MNRLGFTLTTIFYISHGFCANDVVEQNPNIFLNPQDVPIFYENSPLTGLKSFTVITSFPLKNEEMQKKVQQSIAKALKQAGEVVHLKDNDMRGFGAGNMLLIQIDNVTEWDGNKMPVCRISLSIETFVTLEKTGLKTFPMVWSINSFVQGSIDSVPEANLTHAIQKLIKEFSQNYQFANRDQAKGPVFYTYD